MCMLTFFCKGDEKLLLVLEKEIICMNTDLKQEGLMVKENKYQNLVLKQKKMHIQQDKEHMKNLLVEKVQKNVICCMEIIQIIG